MKLLVPRGAGLGHRMHVIDNRHRRLRAFFTMYFTFATMAVAAIGIALVDDRSGLGVTYVMGTSGVVMLWTLLAVVWTSGLIAYNANRLYSMMAWMLATFQAAVLRFWEDYGELLVGPSPDQYPVLPNPVQRFVIRDPTIVFLEGLPFNVHRRAAVHYLDWFPSLNSHSFC